MKRDDIMRFTNWTDKRFVGWWDKESDNFPPGKSKLMQAWKANHYAKHLANQVLNNKNLPTNHQTRQAILDRCVSFVEESKFENKDNAEEELLNKKIKSEMIPEKKEKEEEFADVKKDETSKQKKH